MPVTEKRSREYRNKGWIDISQSDVHANGLREEEVIDRVKSKRPSRKADPGINRDKSWEEKKDELLAPSFVHVEYRFEHGRGNLASHFRIV